MILIVDDDYDIASLIKIILEKAGLFASFFTDPLMALVEFKSHSTDYDLVISDIRMPIMNGYEFVQEVKMIKPSIKILLMSAFEYNDQYFANTFSHSDIDGFVEKPISMHRLQTTILEILNNTKGTRYQTNLDTL